jgi:hypothetical protein
MWAIGITTTITQFVKPPPYLFTDSQAALMYLAPMTGVLIAEVWGHWFNDFLCESYLRKHNGVYKPENRLWGVYPAAIAGVLSLVLYGQILQHHLSWVGIAFGWGINSFGMLAATTAISAYALDCFPGHAALASSWVNFWRVVGTSTCSVMVRLKSAQDIYTDIFSGGFVVTHFNAQWVEKSGAAVAFGSQGAIIAGAFTSIIVVQIWGAKWRARFPAPAAEN